MSSRAKRRAILAALSRLTLRRFIRSHNPLLCVVLATVPIVFAGALRGRAALSSRILEVEDLLLVVLCGIVVSAAISHDLEDRAATYLWCRPVRRSSPMVVNLVVLGPLVVCSVVASWSVAHAIGLGWLPPARCVVGLSLGASAACAVGAAIASLAPRQGMVLSILYLLVDDMIGRIPANISVISVLHNTNVLASSTAESHGTMTAVLGLCLAVTVWQGLALVRARRGP